MNTRSLILTATAGAFLLLPAAQAGERSGGSPGATAVKIPADTLSSGGGTSRAGSGASAVTVTASMGGVIGTVSLAATSNQQGFIPQILPPRLYEIWAAANIPAGRDATFTGDWNRDGILNGVAYVFGNTPVSPTGKGKIPVPPSIPADVNVYLDRSSTLVTWALDRVRWVNGAAPVFVSGNFSIVAGEVVDTSTIAGGKAFYRYRVVRR